MTPFTCLTGIAAPVPIANMDTDQLAPAKFLKTVTREGLGEGLFHARRFDEKGVEKDSFVLNRAPWTSAEILVTLENFGCGSSREHAPWALLGFGIRAVIAPSFADIFRLNCVQSGVLPAIVDADVCTALMALACDPVTACFTIDLAEQTVTAGGDQWRFAIETRAKSRLLQGVDMLSETLAMTREIAAYEARSGAGPLSRETFA